MSRSASLGRMNRYALVLPVLVLLGCATALAGCTAPPPVDSPVPDPVATVEPISAEETCTQWSNVVLTPIANAEVAFAEDRMTQQELDGVARLAVNSLAMLDVEKGTDVYLAIEAARTADDTNIAKGEQPVSDEWHAANKGVQAACEAEGFDVYVTMWTGG